jgi:hypothetical protein
MLNTLTKSLNRTNKDLNKRERIRTYCKEKYQNDEVYKQYKQEQAFKNYYKKKNAAATLQTVKILNLNFFSPFFSENKTMIVRKVYKDILNIESREN